MLDFLFGEGQYGLRFVFAVIVVFVLLGLTAWLVRRFGADRLGGGGTRGRQPRLAVIDAAPVDGRRRLLLIRRDNVEHLVMIGGPTDVLVEANIVRAAAPAREGTPARASAGSDTLPRPVPLGESNLWPLQPQAEPRVEPLPRAEPQAPPSRNEPMIREPLIRAEPPLRPLRAPPVLEPQAAEEGTGEAQTPPPVPANVPQRPARTADPIHGLATELARFQSPGETEAPQRSARQLTRAGPVPAPAAPPAAPAPAPSVAEPDFNSTADQNLADMARSLEAAIRRPVKTEPRATEAPAPRPAPAPAATSPATGEIHYDDGETPTPTPAPAPAPTPAAAPPRAAAPVPIETRPLRSDRPDSRAVPRRPLKPVGGSPPYDSLEQEMASLLGRPNKT